MGQAHFTGSPHTGGDKDHVRAGCDPGGSQGLGELHVHVLTLFWEKRRAGGSGWSRVVCIDSLFLPPHGTLAMTFSRPCCVPQGQSLFVLHAATLLLASSSPAHGDQGSLPEGSPGTETNKHNDLL